MTLYTCPKCNSKFYLSDDVVNSTDFQNEFRCESCGAAYNDNQPPVESENTQDEKYAGIKMPSKPSISYGLLVVGGGLLAGSIYTAIKFYAAGLDMDMLVTILVIVLGALGCFLLYGEMSAYLELYKLYKLAQVDFEEYAKRMTKLTEKFQHNKAELEQRRQEKLDKLPCCPICGKKDNVVRISTLNRTASVATFGLASSKIGKQYQCKHCNHLF